MSEIGKIERPAAPVAAQPSGENPSPLRSLRPGELGSARMNPMREERAAAASQIDRSLKAWRKAKGGDEGGEEKPLKIFRSAGDSQPPPAPGGGMSMVPAGSPR